MPAGQQYQDFSIIQRSVAVGHVLATLHLNSVWRLGQPVISYRCEAFGIPSQQALLDNCLAASRHDTYRQRLARRVGPPTNRRNREDHMGSRGSGKISDYPGSSKGRESGKGPKGGGGSRSPEDRCGRAFSSRLEDIEHSEYYAAHGVAPPVGTTLRIRLRKRLVAETTGGQSVGNIPTALNYLAGCLKEGWKYAGRVSSSNGGPPLASVNADFAPSAP